GSEIATSELGSRPRFMVWPARSWRRPPTSSHPSTAPTGAIATVGWRTRAPEGYGPPTSGAAAGLAVVTSGAWGPKPALGATWDAGTDTTSLVEPRRITSPWRS